jgi:SNF2 family DNA or RNA helicase
VSWAGEGGDGDDVQARLLADVAGARGTEASCKSLFVAGLLDELVGGGHRTLVFSQSRVMLDILQVCVDVGVGGCGNP